jgi:SAM-dependent methyltransferase
VDAAETSSILETAPAKLAPPIEALSDQAGPPKMAYFFAEHYRIHNQARLEHLASLGVPFAGRVLELGSGPGDHTGFYLARGCTVVSVDAREECLSEIESRYPEVTTVQMDMNRPEGLIVLGTFDLVHCYGLLYHLDSPQEAIATISRVCEGHLFLETCVSGGDGHAINPVSERLDDYTQSLNGRGCRPTRKWVFETLRQYFPFVYQTRTQPNHPEFPTDWTAIPDDYGGLVRIVVIASKTALDLPILSPKLLDHQEPIQGGCEAGV